MPHRRAFPTPIRRPKPLQCLAIRLIRRPTLFVLLSGRSRFDSWRGHSGGSLVLVRVSGSLVLRTVPTTCARLPPFPCLNMAFYPRPWSPTLLIESRCANQLLSCSACWCGGWRLAVRRQDVGQKPRGAPVPIDAQSAAPERVWELQIALPRELAAVWQSTPRLALAHDVGSLTQCSFHESRSRGPVRAGRPRWPRRVRRPVPGSVERLLQ